MTRGGDLVGFTAEFRQIEDGWWMAQCVEVPEAVTQGETLEEARENLREALEMVIESRREDSAGVAGSMREPLNIAI